MLLVVGSCLSLPFGAAIAAQLFPALGAWGTTSVRIGLAAIILLLIVRPRVRGWNRKQWGSVVLFGASIAGMNGFFYSGIERIPLGPAVAIEFLGPLVLAAVLTRRLSDGAWVAVALFGMGLLGLDGILGAEPLDILGVIFTLIAAAFWAFYIRMSAKVGEVTPGTSGLAAGLFVAAILLLPVGIPTTVTMSGSGDWTLLLLALATAVLSTVIPYSFELAALRRLPQRMFGVLLSLEPAFATLAGWLVLGQSATALKLIAIALVVIASAGTALGVRGGKDAGRDDRDDPGVFTGSIPVVPN